MRRISLSALLLRAIILVPATVSFAACDDPFGLPDPTIANDVDTLTVFALTNSDIGEPIAFDMVDEEVAVPEFSDQFDFVFDIDGEDAVIMPAGSLGLTRGAGLQIVTDSTFAAIRLAAPDGYNLDTAVTVSAGTVFVARSRSTSQRCLIGNIARFGKFEILSVDPAERTITFRTMVNLNCGYRGLEPGLPAE